MIIFAIPAAIVGIAAVTAAAKSIKKTVDNEKAKREEIAKERDHQIEAARVASAVVRDRIQRGEYDGNFGQVLTDFEFIRITHPYK